MLRSKMALDAIKAFACWSISRAQGADVFVVKEWAWAMDKRDNERGSSGSTEKMLYTILKSSQHGRVAS
jgi:hypothetical protein